MAALQHVYRRGHVFWWRRVHRLFGKSALDMRLSLGTMDRLRARDRGAVLTAMTPGAEFHSAANLAFVDYFERLTRLGGHMSLLPAEQRQLEEKG